MPYLILCVVLAGALCTSAWAQSVEERKTDGVPAPAASALRGGNVEPSAVAEDVLRQTNTFRQQEGRGPVASNRELANAARAFAQFMARTDRYGHEADGSRPSERAERHGYDYCVVAENIAFQYRSTGFVSDELARALVEGWKESPPHRRSMLDRDVVDTGIGVARSDTTGRWYAVQMFGLPQSAQFAFQIANRTADTVQYRLGDQTFDLPPRVTRTHEQCRATKLTVDFPGKQPAASAQPRAGERYSAVVEPSGRWRLERE